MKTFEEALWEVDQEDAAKQRLVTGEFGQHFPMPPANHVIILVGGMLAGFLVLSFLRRGA